MKTVKLNYVGVFDGFNPKQNLVYDILKGNGYDVQISDDPDYIICDVFGENPYEWCKYPQVRIMYNGENFIPDLNLIDYAICTYPISLLDRCFHLPACVWPRSHWLSLAHRDRAYPPEFVSRKPYFANFIASHESENGIRGDFFRKLCQYKRVESPGTYLNNMPNGFTVDWTDESKTEFQRKCKFTLCFESTKSEGFVTEKLMDAFYADTIPVYFGSDTAKDIFNPNAFIHCSDYDSFDAVIEKIKELDQNDEQYLEMLRQPVLVDPDYPERLERELNQFICHIFDQPLEQAYRRSRVFHPKRYNDYLTRAVDSEQLTMKNLTARMGQKVLNRLGHPGRK
ncbi:MAG: glycosyltransferase family 10 [Firmicutes bacterium]|nr:glycosyltransferase family 10 [Bacillota bacterium]